jgi:hypothetical protein
MSTPIYKVIDGSVITFSTRGPLRSAILTKSNGEVIKGREWMSSAIDYPGIAEEILLANNIVDNNAGGAPLPYTIEGGQDSSTQNSKGNNIVYEIPRKAMSEATDETALNTAKTNKEILSQDNKALNKTLNAELPPEVKFSNFVNSQKVTIKKRLIPFIIGLITPFAPQVIPLVISNLGISEDSTLDSVKANAQDKADQAKNAANGAKETAKDKEALKAAAAGVGAAFILGKITKDQLIGLIDCPSSSKIQSVIKLRASLVTQINGMYDTIKKTATILGITATVISAIQLAINLAESNPYPATGVPPLGLPPMTAGLQAKISSFIAKVKNEIVVNEKTITTVNITIASFATFLGIILKFLDILDVILEHCAGDQNMDLEQINAEINALANPTVVATQNNSDNQNINTYKGFTLGVKIDEKNESKYIRRYAVAQNRQGIDVLRTDSSFASDPSVLISQLKFIIDTTPNITAE